MGKGERVFVLAGRIPELYVAVLGTLKNGSVLSPLFSAFGPEPIAARLRIGGAAGRARDAYVPEADYAKLATLETCVGYLAGRGA